MTDENSTNGSARFEAEETTHFEIAKLELHEGDRLVVKVDTILTAEHAAQIKSYFRQHVPEGVEVIVIDREISLAVLARPV